jgi:hypothetical protein
MEAQIPCWQGSSASRVPNPEGSQTEEKIPSELKRFRARHDVGGRREAPRRGASGDENARQVTKCRHSADTQQSGGRGRPPLRRLQTGPGRLGAEDGAPSMTSTKEIVTSVMCEGCLRPVLISPMVRLLARVTVLQQALKR